MDGKAVLTGKPTPGDKVRARVGAQITAQTTAQVTAHVAPTDKSPHPDNPPPAELPRTYLPRPRLDRRWDEWESRRVVVIEAPAGYGKTTLIAANVRRSGRRILWLTFDSAHAGLPALMESLDSVLSQPGVARCSSEAAGAPEVKTVQPPDPADPSNALVRFIHAIRDTREGWNIVLDDLHRCDGAGNGSGTGATATPRSTHTSPLTTFLDDLIDRLPAGNTLFLASRQPVGIRMSKLRLAEQAVRLTGQDLSFTPEETAAYFRAHLGGRALNPQELERISARIEGWPAGLAFCLQELERGSGRAARRGSYNCAARASDSGSDSSPDSGASNGADSCSGNASDGPFLKPTPAADDSTDDSPDGTAWSSYFAEEVVATLDPSIVRFVMRASVLPVLTPGLCDDILGTRDSRMLLRDLHRRNLFTFPIAPSGPLASDAASTSGALAALASPVALVEPVAPLAAIVRDASPSEPSYRFHPLFQEFLARRLAATLPDQQVRSLRRRAARRLLREGAWAEALVLLTDAGDAGSILRLIERRGLAILHEGHAAILLRAFAAMDSHAYAARSRALFVLGSIHEAQGRPDEAEAAFEQGLRGLPKRRGSDTAGAAGHRAQASRPDTKLRLELMTLLITLKIQRGRHLEAIRLCREALAARDWTNLRAWARLVGMLGGCLSELGRCDEAEKEFLRAGEAYARGGDPAGEAQVRFLLATCVHHPRGELGEAEAGIRRALEYFRGVDDLGICCHCCAILAFFAIEDGDEVKARDLAVETLRQAEGFRLPEVAGLCHLTLGRCALLRARTDNARSLTQAPTDGSRSLADRADAASHFSAALEIGETIAHTDLNIYPRLGLAEVALDREDLRLARMHAAGALAHARRRHVRFGMAQACVVIGCVEAAHPRHQARIRSWRRAEWILRAMGAHWHLHRLLLLRFRVADAPAGQIPTLLRELLAGIIQMRHESLLLTHERAAGTAALATAFRLDIARKEAAELLLRLGADAIPDLAKGLTDPDRRIRKACADLIARIGGDEARRVLDPLKNPTTEVGRVAIRAHLDSMRRPAPPLRICALGPLRVSIGDRIVSPDDWPSTPAMRVFLFLLTRRFRTVERDTLIEALWPHEPVRRARHGLSQAIHILRRVLEPDLSPHQPSSYLRASTEEVRLEPGDGATYDVVRFEEGLARTATPTFPGKDTAITIERLQRTLALYRGEFAEAFPDENYLRDERRKLRNMWLRGASQLLAILVTRRAWSVMIPLADLAVTRDPSSEKFHHHLITAYYESGNRSAALRAYKRYEKIVYADPLAHLSSQMRDLFERIRAS